MFQDDEAVYKSVRPSEVQARRARGEFLRLIDVREPEEHEMAAVDGAELLPMSRFERWAKELNREDELVIMCHHGVRSAHVCRALAARGFRRLSNLTGGIDLWSAEVDANVPRY
ncbi:MAG: rhodanese-like domain-containing protein [Pyrinomonadaceae bacterium]